MWDREIELLSWRREVAIMWPLRGSHHVVGVNGHCHFSRPGHSSERCRGAGDVSSVGECLSSQRAIFRVENLLPLQLESRAIKEMGLRLSLSGGKHRGRQQNIVRAFWTLSFPRLQPGGSGSSRCWIFSLLSCSGPWRSISLTQQPSF